MADGTPRFRQDLVATSSEAEGVVCIDVQDPRTGNTFRFYDFEYALAVQLNGQPLADVVHWAATAYGMELTPEGVREFAEKLAELGFLEDAPYPHPDGLEARGDSFEDNQPVSEVVSQAIADSDHDSGFFEGPPTDLSRPPERAWRAGADPRPVSEIAAAAFTDAAIRDTDQHPAAASGEFTGRASDDLDEPGVSAAAAFAGAATREVDPATVAAAAAATGSSGVPAGDSQVPQWAWEIDRTLHGVGSALESPQDRVHVPLRPSLASRSDEVEPHFPAPRAVSSPADAFRAVAPASPGEPPPGRAERRQPPSPDAVEMAPFEEGNSRRFRAPTLERPPAGRGLTIVLLLVAAAVGAAALYHFWWQKRGGAPPRQVRVLTPKPAAIYRWFETPGAVVAGGARALAFPSSGKVVEILPAGTRFAPGEIIGRLQGAAAQEAEISKQRSRISYYEQMRDSMAGAGNPGEVRQAESKLAEKKALLGEADRQLSRLILRSAEGGEIAEVMVKAGAKVAAGAPALKLKGGALRGEFALDPQDMDKAGQLGFCRVEAGGRSVDCKLPGAPPPAGKPFVVDLPAGPGLTVGQPLRLARSRYDGVFPLPRSALVRVGDTDRLYVVTARGAAEARAITVADSTGDEILVSQGIDVGEAVILDPSPDLERTPMVTVRN
jgi:multidrug efflux pump subunit AcrA (membrane-fusion protein)